MFDFFSRGKRLASIQIKAETIRFVEILRVDKIDRITAYGEIIPEQEFFKGDRVIDRPTFLKYLKDIKQNLRTDRVKVSIPLGGDKDEFLGLLNKVNLKVEEFVPASEALVNVCVPEGAGTSFLILNIDALEADFAGYHPSGQIFNYKSDSASHAIISNLNHIYIDWYDKYKERINHVLITGTKASDNDFIEYISRETKIHIVKANIFVNLRLAPDVVPIITKEDSYKYAVAMGMVIT